MKHTIFSIIAITIFILMSFTDGMSQRCKNALVNGNADQTLHGWERHEHASVNGAKRFFVKESGSHLYQDVAIPARSKFAYFGGWSKNSKKATVGHGYLYGYIMDANDKIIEYVQLGVQNETTNWKYQSKKVNLTAAAKKVRFFLKKSAKKDVADQKNIANFDNLILSFNCGKPTPNPGTKTCRNTLKNHNAKKDKANWTFYQSALVINSGGQKSFAVKTSGSNAYQDVTVPNGSRYAYFGGWTRNSKIAQTGQAYLYGYVMDASDKIIEYVQLGVVNKSTKWGYQDKTVTLTGAAKKIRFFLKRSNINGVTDVKNVAYFDNLTLSFDCKKRTSKPKTITGSACRNLLKNPNGGNPRTWKAHQEAEVKNGIFTVKKADAHLYQDVKIPAGKKYAYLAGYTKNLRPVKTGHAYLYAYIMDANDKILDYVQFDTPSSATTWKLSQKVVQLKKGAKKVRFFLKKSSKKDVADSKNYALFDNLKVSFDCRTKPTMPR